MIHLAYRISADYIRTQYGLLDFTWREDGCCQITPIALKKKKLDEELSLVAYQVI